MRQRLSIIALIATGTLALSACSGAGEVNSASETDGESSTGTGELRTVSIGMMAIAPSAAVEYGIQEGIFESHGIALETSIAKSGSDMLPAVTNGQMDFGLTGPLPPAYANDKGMDLRILSGYSNALIDGDDINAVIVKNDSEMQDHGDLAGHTTAIVALRSHAELTVLKAAEQEGADPQDLEFTEIGFSEMEAQLDQGNVDAMFVAEPFLSRALQNPDNRLLGYSVQETIPGLPMLVTFTSGKLADQDPELVQDFRAAMDETLAAAAENEDAVRELIPEFMNVPPEAAAQLPMEDWDGTLHKDRLQDLFDIAVDYDYLSGQVEEEVLYVD